MSKNKITTIDQYSKKYRNRRYRLLKISKKVVEDFDKRHNFKDNYLLKGHKWILIDKTYYEIPKAPGLTWFRNLNTGIQIGACTVGAGLIAGAITVGVMYGTQPHIEYITYTLDSDIKLEKNPNYDIEIVNDSNLPGKTIKHKNTNSSGEFKVAAFTDLHLDHKKECCNYTFSMLARNIMEIKPDLIVFCGDNITSSYNEPRTIQFAEMLEKLGVYWCAVLGNHEKNKDNPHCIERDKMINIWCKYPHCLIDNKDKYTSKGEKVWGVGNSLVNLYGNNGVVQSLFFLDSGTEMTDEQKVEYANEINTYINEFHRGSSTLSDFYDHIKDSQVTWYKETFTKIRNLYPDNQPHSTIFTHVPLIEQEDVYLKLFNEWEDATGKERSERAKTEHMRVYTDYPQTETEWSTKHAKDARDLYNTEEGFVKGKFNRRREGVCYSPHDIRTEKKNESTPILKAMTEFGNNNALFCGHDHENNYTLKTKGQFLGYIQFGAYSTSNLYRDGLLGKDPYNPEDTSDPYSGHLNEGYTELIYKEESNGQKNIIDSIDTKESYYIWKDKKPELYNRALDVIKNQMLTGNKPKVYKDIHESFLDGKN